MKEIKKNDVFMFKTPSTEHEVIVTETGVDEGREWATIQPTGNYGFPINIWLDQYDMVIATPATQYTKEQVVDIIDIVTDEINKMINETFIELDTARNNGDKNKEYECKIKRDILLECKYKMFKKTSKVIQ